MACTAVWCAPPQTAVLVHRWIHLATLTSSVARQPHAAPAHAARRAQPALGCSRAAPPPPSPCRRALDSAQKQGLFETGWPSSLCTRGAIVGTNRPHMATASVIRDGSPWLLQQAVICALTVDRCPVCHCQLGDQRAPYLWEVLLREAWHPANRWQEIWDEAAIMSDKLHNPHASPQNRPAHD